jgi:ubiquinone/menaquinone biosynthesis C-methylase UbiE
MAADAYKLPFRSGMFDAATMIRVIHHMADVSAALRAVRHVLISGGTFVLEHANKQNLKAILRYALRHQDWNPHDLNPVEFVELNFDFHPEYIRRELQAAGSASGGFRSRSSASR